MDGITGLSPICTNYQEVVANTISTMEALVSREVFPSLQRVFIRGLRPSMFNFSEDWQGWVNKFLALGITLDCE